ncbi:hypothetical protein NLI96_g8501 [Meripilus lineatus]|uniref:Cytochrome P450 n=1 Tax=Meripilus lineatus TaxID=2056292 RepID=A0AAD5UX59_9APHY|nr:hypothetical protein NLI96_g8501 [Physisporinus lineatus]
MAFLLPLLFIGAFVAYKVLPILLEPFLTPLRRIPGPPNASWLWGNLKEIREGSEPGGTTRKYLEKYGHVARYKLFLSSDRLLTTDAKALNHVLTHSAEYQKPDHTRAFLLRIFGEGLLFAEGSIFLIREVACLTSLKGKYTGGRCTYSVLKFIRELTANPAFGPAQIREFTDIFFQKSIQLRDLWITKTDAASADGDVARINVLSGLTNMTLDVIGIAGFGYEFNALNPSEKPNPLGQAMTEVLSSGTQPSVIGLVQSFVPILRFIKAAIITSSKQGGIDLSKRDVEGRDLLTLLIKANMASDIPENQRLSDEEVIAQIPTFFIAGHETTAGAVTWCLFALSQDKIRQQKLREELLSVSTDTPTMDELMSLPYLDNVLRETLRRHPPVTNSVRQATKDDFIPLSKPYTDIYGQVHDSIQVKAGDRINIPILAVNCSKEMWGGNADDFIPERWENPPECVSDIPGVWGHVLSFLGGPRACIGYRFSLVEFKVIVFTLLRAFEFDLAVPSSDIIKKANIVTRPIVKTGRDACMVNISSFFGQHMAY